MKLNNAKISPISQPIWTKLWILNIITIPNKSHDTKLNKIYETIYATKYNLRN